MVTRLALIARGDRGGLGSQTVELHRHLKPAKTLVMDLADAGRGRTSIKEFVHGQIRINVGPIIEDANLTWLLEDVDVLFTVECDYQPKRDSEAHLWEAARNAGVKTILQANPELLRQRYRPDVLIVPTTWEMARLPGAVHLPMPVATDRLPFRQRTEARTFVHMAAPAMEDRNGTLLVVQAVRMVTEPCRLILRGPVPRRLPRMGGNVEVIVDDSSCERYWECWHDESDVLIMPRRYGGLSLPIQEAAALGIPTLTFGIPPQSDWPGMATIRASAVEQVPCIGGTFPLYDCPPVVLARRMDSLVQSPQEVADLSADAHEWAESISWDRLLPRYLDLIERTAAKKAA